MNLRIEEGRNYGRIEVDKFGFWSPICSQGWTNLEANAACQQLKFAGGVTYFAEMKQSDHTPVFFGGFNCSDKSLEFVDCPHKSFGEDIGCQFMPTTVAPRKVAGVLCHKNEGS